MRTSQRTLRALAGVTGATLALTVTAAAILPTSASAATDCTAFTVTKTIDLWTSTGNATLTTTVSVPVLGYVRDTAPTLPLAAPGGPLLSVDQGDVVQVNLHNTLGSLGQSTSLAIPQMDGFTSDAIGAVDGGTASYCFTAGRPGTYLYQAGVTADGPKQVARGLAGAFVVRPTPRPIAPIQDTVTGNPVSAFDVEKVLVLSEIDPALNASPSTFDMRGYSPKYRLINGKAYPATDHIAVPAGQKLALRTVNAGLSEHSLGVLGLRQSLVANASHALTYPSDVFAETAQPGQTLDSIVTVPATSSTSSPSYLLYETAAGDGVSAVQNFGGMATTIDVSATTVVGAPVVSNVVITPTSVSAGTPVGVTADAASTTAQNVARLEWQLDSVGSWTAVPVTPALTVAGVAFSVATTGLTAGTHTVSVRAVDDTTPTALVGTAVNATFTVTGSGTPSDTTGPLVTGLTVLPAVSDGRQTIQISATGDDRTTGNSNVASATVTVSPATTPAVTAAFLNRTDNPVAAITASIPAPTSPSAAHAAGTYTVTLTATDAIGNVGASVTKTFLVDQTGPTVSEVLVNPALNDGTLESRTGSGVFTVSAKLTDSVSIGYGEAFFDTAGAPGTGFPLIVNSAVDPNNSALAAAGITVTGDIPLSQLVGMIEGPHQVLVRGRDGAGNWGAVGPAGTLTINRPGPVTTVSVTSANPTNVRNVTLSVSATDVGGTPVAQIEYYIGTTDPGKGAATAVVGNPATVNAVLPAGPDGNYTFTFRAKDTLGSWGAPATATVMLDTVVPIVGATVTVSPTSVYSTHNVTVSGTVTDAAPSSGVTAVEAWIDSTAVPVTAPGPADGLTSLVVTPTATGATYTGSVIVPPRNQGTYRVNVRSRDLAGNVSTLIRRANFTVLPNAISTSTFESATPAYGWSSRTGTGFTTATAAPVIAGNRSGSVSLGTSNNYLTDNLPNGETAFYAEFKVVPVSPGAAATAATIYQAYGGNSGGAPPMFRVLYRRTGATNEVALTTATGTPAAGDWKAVGTTAATASLLRVSWNGATASLTVDGLAAGSVTQTGTIQSVRLGSIVGGTGLGTLRFDSYVSARDHLPLP
jgi:hypothetical protein